MCDSMYYPDLCCRSKTTDHRLQLVCVHSTQSLHVCVYESLALTAAAAVAADVVAVVAAAVVVAAVVVVVVVQAVVAEVVVVRAQLVVDAVHATGDASS